MALLFMTTITVNNDNIYTIKLFYHIIPIFCELIRKNKSSTISCNINIKKYKSYK